MTDSNRKNAQKSTGPKTKIGKLTISKNSLRHGIFAKEVVITGGDGAENQEEFDNLLKGLIKDYQPEGMQEMLLVEKIAVDNWRLKRVIRFENGVLRRQLDNYERSALENYYDELESNYAFGSGHYLPPPENIMKQFIHLLHNGNEEELMQAIDRYARLSGDEEALKNDEDLLWYILYEKLDIAADELDPDLKEQALEYIKNCSPVEFDQIKKEFLKGEHSEIKKMTFMMQGRERFEFEERVRRLPKENEIDKIIKYETHLERNITKNITLLLTLQQNRQARNFKETTAQLN